MTAAPTAPARRARTMAITSGKGGVGKNFVSANLGAALVLNLPPHVTLHDVVGGRAGIEEAIQPGPMGLSVLLAGSGLVEYSRMTPHVRDELQRVLAEVTPRFDHVILDTGAGISDVVLYTISLADEVLVVVTPEPTSMTDAYATIKVLATQQQRRHLRVLVNQTRRAGEGRTVCQQLQQVVDRFFNPTLDSPVRLEFIGEVPADPAVRDAVLKRELMLQAQPGSAASMAVVELASRLVRRLEPAT
jgi:flagellar biosynthesis protein FlhG